MSLGMRQTRPRRRWWQVLIRAAVLPGLVLLGFYVTLPWWMPTRWLRGYLERQMSDQMGVSVHIDGLSVSWSNGVEIRELMIDSPEPFGPGAMAFVSRLQADFSPLNLILHRRIAWMELQNPRLFIRVDSQGRLNLAPLGRLKFDVLTDRISIRRGLVVLKLPDRKEPIRLDISNVEVLAGRFYPVGRVAMSAALNQGLTSAPISIRFSEGPQSGPVAGTASLTFRNVDLQRLKLEQLFGLPLRKLSGDCCGEVAVSATRQGKVNRFTLDVTVRELDVQPAHGPNLPVIDQALVRMTAGFDFLTGRLDIRSAGVRLPGVDLTGAAVAYLDSQGQWERLSSLQLRGKIFPQRLAVLLRGRASRQDEPEVLGPVHVRFTARERDIPGRGLAAGVLSLTAHAAADEAVIRRGRHILKPAGRRLQVSISGDLDMQDLTYRTSGEQVVLLGGNRFAGAGAVRNLRLLTERFSARKGPRTIQQALADLSHLQWAGSWRIRDLQSLGDLWPSVSGLLAQVELDGEITGQASIDHADGTVIRARASIPAEANFAVGGLFHKPPGAELKVVFSGSLGDGNAAMRDIDMFVWAGDGRVHVYNANAALKAEPNATPTLTADGGFEVEKVESFLDCFALPPEPNLSLRGNLQGKCKLTLGDRVPSVQTEINLTETAVSVGDYYRKPTGEWAELVIMTGPGAKGIGDCVLVSYTFPGSVLGRHNTVWALVEGEWPLAETLGRFGHVSLDANIMDAASLVEASPALQRMLAGAKLTGHAKLSGEVYWSEDGNTDLQLEWDGDGLSYEASGTPVRPELHALRSSGEITGSVEPPHPDGHRKAKLQVRSLRLGGSIANLTAQITFDPGNLISDGRVNHDAIKQATLDGNAAVVFDGHLLGLVPWMEPVVHEHQVSGVVGTCWQFALRDNRIAVAADIDASRLEVGGRGDWIKPDGLLARAKLKLTCPRDLSSVKLERLHARLGEANVSIGASARLAFDEAGRPVLSDRSVSVAFETGRADALDRMVLALRPHKLKGGVSLAAEWSDADGGSIRTLQFHPRQLSAVHRGRRVEINGVLRVEGITNLAQLLQPDANTSAVGIKRIGADGLEFRVGDNHGWLVADLTDPLTAPSGRIRLLAEHIDSKDLSDWLGDSNTAAGDEPLTAEGSKALERRATEALAFLGELLGQSRLEVRCSIDRFRTFDPDVRQMYDVRHMVLDANIDRGRATLELLGGVGGGTVRRGWRTDLNNSSPVLVTEASYRDVLATDATRPQLARFFPGNTVHGSFTHDEAQTMPLARAIANTFDPRYPLGSSGTGKTVALDGTVQGRAAPKFVTAIFPGLNLTKYRYKKMTAFSEYKPDGSVDSDMIFTGTVYDLYMEGVTDANSMARYQTGIILLSSPQTPELNHDLKLGRIPILIVKARIADGQLHDMEVSYPWPNESLGTIFITNNPFYRLWVTLQKK